MNKAINMRAHKGVLGMQVNRFIVNKINPCMTHVLASDKLLSKGSKAQGQGIQGFHLLTGFFHPDIQGTLILG